MDCRPLRSLPVLLLAAGLVPTPGAPAAAQSGRPVWDSAAGTFITVETMLDRLDDAEVVYVGETHTDFAHHLAQLAVLESMQERNRSLVMGWEMFHSSQQPLLDAYTYGQLTEVEWLDAIYWAETWGHAYPYYEPLLDFARDEGVRIFGLNAPRTVVRGVRIEGEENLPEDLAWWLPGGFWLRLNIDSETEYKAWFMETARHMPSATDSMMESMFHSQTAWNEIMGWNVVKAFNIIPDPDLQVLVIVGSGHAVFRQGIPTRVDIFKPGLDQIVIIPHTSESVMTRSEILEEELHLEGDFIWFVPPAEDPPGVERPERPTMPPRRMPPPSRPPPA